jgi:hypothetical protein
MKPYPSPRTVRLYLALTSRGTEAFVLMLAGSLVALALSI